MGGPGCAASFYPFEFRQLFERADPLPARDPQLHRRATHSFRGFPFRLLRPRRSTEARKSTGVWSLFPELLQLSSPGPLLGFFPSGRRTLCLYPARLAVGGWGGSGETCQVFRRLSQTSNKLACSAPASQRA